jgi:MFS family permease
MLSKIKNRNLLSVYLLGFLFAFHVALPTYINSSFLDVFMSEKSLGIVYTIASVLTIFFFFLAPLFLRMFGNYRVAFSLILIELFALTSLILGENPLLLATSFIISILTIPFIYFSLDIFLESFSEDKKTGRVRGIYLTMTNLAWIFSPIISGFILTKSNYWGVYLFSLLFLLPILFILSKNFSNFRDSKYEVTSISNTLKTVWKSKNIRNIFSTSFLLHFFYSWMTIYTPLYLHKYAGFSWTEIGIIFGIMLLPFVLVQFPLGKMADEKMGEKEILSIGFFLTAISTMALFFIPQNSSLWLWAVLLFITRIGASSIEIMTDTFFFKNVNNLNANIISFFRTSRPVAYVLGPLVASLSLNFVKVESGGIFIILGVIMLSGLFFSLRLKDTK